MIVNILLSVVSFLEGFLAVILLGQRRKPINFYFGLTVFAASIWVFSGLMFRLITGPSLLFWCKTQYAAGAFIVVCFLFFTHIFPSGKINISILKRTLLLLIPAALIIMIYYPGVFIKNIEIVNHYYKEVSFGNLAYLVYGLFIMLGFGWAFLNLFKSYLKHKGLIKQQLNYFIFGTGISVIAALIFDIVLPWFNYFYFWAGTIASISMVVFISYAILKKKLFGIKLILTEMLLAVISILLLIEIFSSESVLEYLGRGMLFLLFVFFGYLLIKSVFKEIYLREQLAITNKELERLNQEKSDFLNIASHQLRTPMTIIKGYISMMQEGLFGKTTKEAEDAMTKVYISNERLIKLINDLLDISRIERGKMKYSFEKQDIEKVVKNTVAEFEPVAQDKGLAFNYVKPDSKIPEIRFDVDYIRQVLTNLLDNAIKYTKKGEINVSISSTPKNIQIKVRDTGQGLNEKEISRLFERYQRGTKESIKGMGIGLYIAKKIIDDHHGKIWAESEGEEKGSAFFVELPIG